MHSSINVANQLLILAREDKKTLTPMQLIKLVFLCHGWMLGLYGKHLINEPIEAWRYGPVISNLYQNIKHFRSNPVNYPIPSNSHKKFSAEEEDIIQQVYKIYRNLSGIELSSLTHQKNSPWDISWENGSKYISNDLIEFYYKNLSNAQQKNS